MAATNGPTMIVHTGSGDTYNGRDLLGEILDVLHAGLPRLAADDPAAPALRRLAPVLARDLGQRPVRPTSSTEGSD